MLGRLLGWCNVEDLDQRFCKHNWRCMVRFGLWQENHQAWRCIDNGKTSNTNDTHATSEKGHTTSSTVGYGIVRRMRALNGGKFDKDT